MKKQFNILISLIIVIFSTSCSINNNANYTEKEQFVDSLINLMTIDEKIGQLTLFTSDWTKTGPTIRDNYKEDIQKGLCGNIFNAHTAAYNLMLQKIAVEETRLGIPLLLGYDVIHGYKTQFPIPIAEACSWDLKLIEESARLSAKEATAGGLNWNFNPMIDIARDPRWGRIAEGSGEDPFLTSEIAKAKVHGYQGKSLSDNFTIAACMKHFAAYGAAEAGRDYNTVDMSERRLREIYLPPFKAAVEAGVASVMTAFNEVNGIPATGDKFLLKDILRNEWGFKGVVVTDYTGVAELIEHGYAKSKKNAGEIALNAGVDVDMQSAIYYTYLKKSIAEGKVSMSLVNQAVKNVLSLKYDLGLFKNPYKYTDTVREKEVIYSNEMFNHAFESAKKSIVLLKNEPFNGKKLLPLSKNVKNIALIGPLGDDQEDLLGTWHAAGDASKVITLKSGLENKFPNVKILYSKGCGFEGNDESNFSKALKIAEKADIVLLAVGENYRQNGEAASRSNIDLPGVQQELVEKIYKTGKPIIAIVMAGRPLTITWIDANIPAILYAWHLGTKSGDAIAEVLSGDYNPSAKLVVTFPQNVGQIPIYYNTKNTGRPFDANSKYTTKYIDVSNDPLYPFGYGLSYTTYKYSDLQLNKSIINFKDTLDINVKVSNTGNYLGEEIVQLYIRDMVASVTRPVKELKGFKKIKLNVNESKVVTFKITANDLKFYNDKMEFVAEQGLFKVFVGTNSVENIESSFSLKK